MSAPEENRNRFQEIRDNDKEGSDLKKLNILIRTPEKVLDLREYLVAPRPIGDVWLVEAP
jgi:hypothetical protein